MKRTTVLLERDVYDGLVRESLQEYKNTKSISKVMNKLLKRALSNKGRLTGLLHSKKVAYISQKDFEKFRRDLSRSMIER